MTSSQARMTFGPGMDQGGFATINFSSVSINGIFNYARARVLWRDGVLRIFTVPGLHLEIASRQPVKRSGFLRTWDVKTDKGNIVMKGKCITCGGSGWLRLVAKSSDALWRVPV